MFGFTLSKDLKLGEIIALFSLGIVLLGFYSIYNYYLLFGVDITPYLEPTEIIFSFAGLTRLAVYVLFFALLFPMMTVLYHDIRNNGFKLKEHFFPIIIRAILIAFYVIIFSYIFTGSLFSLTMLLLLSLLFLPIIVLLSFSTIPRYYVAVISILGIFETIHIFNQFDHLNVILFGQPEYSFEFVYDNEEVCTDENLLFVGVTRNYLFLWDKPSQTVITYSFKDLKRVKSKKLQYNKRENGTFYKTFKYYRDTGSIY